MLRGVSVLINHAILGARDKLASARFFADLFDSGRARGGRPVRPRQARRRRAAPVRHPARRVEISPIHLAFLVDDATFDHLVARLEALGLDHWADPRRSQPGINHNHGGRGVYFLDPSGNYLEAITRPYAD